jgi:hypothetical protein
MRDALERFAVSISQGRVILGPTDVFDIVNRLVTPKDTAGAVSSEEAGKEGASSEGEPEQDPFSAFASWGPTPASPQENPEATQPPPQFAQPAQPAPFTSMEVNPLQLGSEKPRLQPIRRKSRKGISVFQWLFLAAMFLFWCLIVAGFGYYIWTQGLLP